MSDEALLRFLAHSLELERESGERYRELAEVMAAHHNAPVAAFFGRMAAEAGQHHAEVEGLAAGRELPVIHAWDFEWPGEEPPETTSYEAVHYRMGLAEAMRLALRNERAAQAFYSGWAAGSPDPEVERLAGLFAAEEASHAAQLEAMLAELPPDSPLAREEDDAPHMPE
jgi:rubrerythrin